MKAPIRRWIIVAAFAIFITGAASAVWGIASMKSKMATISKQQLLLMRLNDLERRAGAIDDARQALEALGSRTPADIDDLIRKAGFTDKVTDSRDGLDNAGKGWSILTREAALSDVVLSDLDAFFAICQDGRPPWTLTKIVVRSSPFESGRGQAVFTLQALRGKSQ